MRIVIRKVCRGESPISLETIMNLLSMYPIALLIKVNAIGRV